MSTSRSTRQTILLAAAVLLIALSAFLPAVQHDFINFDDPKYITENAPVNAGLTRQGVLWAFTTFHASNWHPLTWLSHMLDVQVFGPDPSGHHLTSVALHGLNAVLLFLVLARMTGSNAASVFAALLFALHPLRVESVAWVSERKDVLSGLFGLLALLAYERYARRPGVGRYVLVALLLALGLMAKPMLVTWPFLFLVLDVWPLGRCQPTTGLPRDDRHAPASGPRTAAAAASFERLALEKTPLFVLAAASAAVTFVAQQRGGAVTGLHALPLRERLGNAACAYLAYLGKTFWPADLSVFYPLPDLPRPAWQVSGCALLLAAATAVALWQAPRRPALAAGWLWYLVTLLPVIGLVQAGAQAMADRYTYLPQIGLFVIMGWCAPGLVPASWPRRRLLLGLAAGLVLAALAAGTSAQIRHWRNSVTLFRHALRLNERNALAHVNLGAALAEMGKYEHAESHLARALEIDPDDAEAHNNLGVLLAGRDRPTEAREHLRQAVRLSPHNAEAFNNLGSLEMKGGDLDAASACLAEAVRLQPGHAAAHFNLGLLLAGKGRLEEAEWHFRACLEARSDHAAAHNNLGNLLARRGRLAEAVEHLREALRLQPGYSGARYNLGIVLSRERRWTEAAEQFSRVVQADPGHAEAFYQLAQARLRTGEANEAAAAYRESMRLKPDWPAPALDLAWLRATHPQAEQRDGQEALALARRVLEIAREGSARALDVMAAAWAEAGDFAEAERWAAEAQEKAAAAGQAVLVESIRERLEGYRAGRPHRERPITPERE
ncbi:MAG: tetratricopeptide repeat protein [Planctomycetes bacterium]|nr:tetratricopeptide repeat protein [Planctomycetota bacterium]